MQMNTLRPYACEKKQQMCLFGGSDLTYRPLRALILPQIHPFTKSVTKFLAPRDAIARKYAGSNSSPLNLLNLFRRFTSQALASDKSHSNVPKSPLIGGFLAIRGYFSNTTVRVFANLASKCDEILTFTRASPSFQSFICGKYNTAQLPFCASYINRSFSKLVISRYYASRTPFLTSKP